MKIVGPTPVERGKGKPRNSGSAGGGDFASKLAGSDAADARAPVSGLSPVGSVDALLALQGEGDSHGVDEREARRGHALLDELEAIREGLLLGSIPRGRLEALTGMLERRPAFVSSPRLRDVMDDIELRVKVELAKLSAASG